MAFWSVVLLNTALLGGYRLAFWIGFRPRSPDTPAAEIRRALGLGTRFDLRLALLLALPLLLLSLIPGLGFAAGQAGPALWAVALTAAWIAVTALYLLDAAHYDYLLARLDASVVEHLDAPGVALHTGWQSFPVVRGLVAWILAVAAYAGLARVLLADGVPALARAAPAVSPAWAWTLSVVVILAGLHGRAARFPLRWSDAYASSHPFAAALALNPVLFLYDTWANRRTACDVARVREHYPHVSRVLEVPAPDPHALEFARRIEPVRAPATRPNVVIVVLESFATYKVGAFGNALDPTPCFDAVARRSLLFERFFAVTAPTARSMFTLVTGIPDVNAVHSASRNPRVVRQRTLLNAFTGYRKLFFIGGSASWGNIRGVLSHNVPDLEIHEERDFDAPRADGWGISDRNLFIEADRVFRREESPFVALMLASGNHRPWTIPQDSGDFERRHVDIETLRANGFDSLEEFNSFRLMDHALGELFRRVEAAPYGRDTIVFVIGDHGAGAPRETPWERLGLTHVHTPLAIHAPGRLEPRVCGTIASSVDVLPTALGLADLAYENTTFGRDLLVERPPEGRLAFVRKPPHHGLVGDDFFYRRGPGGTGLYRYRSETPCDEVSADFPEEARRMSTLCDGLLETARYMLLHPGRPRCPPR